MINLESIRAMQNKPSCFIKQTEYARASKISKHRSTPKHKTINAVELSFESKPILTRGEIISITGYSKDTIKNSTNWMHRQGLMLKRKIGNAGNCTIYEYKINNRDKQGGWL